MEGRCRCQATSNDADTKNGKEEDAKKRRPLSRRRGRRIVKKAKMSVRFSLPSYCGLFAKPHNMGDSFLGAEKRETTAPYMGSVVRCCNPPKKRISSELAARDNEMLWNKSESGVEKRKRLHDLFLGGTQPKFEQQFRMCITSTDFTPAGFERHKRISDVPARIEEQRYLHHFSFVPWHSLAPEKSLSLPMPPRIHHGRSDIPCLFSQFLFFVGTLRFRPPGYAQISRLMMGECGQRREGEITRDVGWANVGVSFSPRPEL